MTDDRNSGTWKDTHGSAQDHINGRAFTVYKSYRKFCPREPPRFPEMPIASRAIYCQSTLLPTACLRRQNAGNMPNKKCSYPW